MKYAYKTELKPTEEQAAKMQRAMGICRWLYNRYITENQKLNRMYQRGLLDEKQPRFISAIDFDKYVNNKLKVQKQYAFIDKCGSKARKKAIVNAQTALLNFLKGKAFFPRFKCKEDQDATLYFPKNNKIDWMVQRHRLRVPTIGWVRLKEYGYLPTDVKVINGTISCTGGRYYVSITVEQEQVPIFLNGSIGIAFEFTDKTDPRIIRLRQQIDRVRRSLHRKYRLDRQNGKNKFKQHQLLNGLYKRLDDIYTDAANKLTAQIMAQKPAQIIFPYADLKDARIKCKKNTAEGYHEHICRYIAKVKLKLNEKCQRAGVQFCLAKDVDIETVPMMIVSI